MNAGIFSAVGYAGATYSYSPIRVFELEAGAGWGYTGLQLSMMPKLSVGSDNLRFVMGAGVSTGLDLENDYTSWWLNGEVGLLVRGTNRLSLLVAAGFTVGLAGEKDPFCLMGCQDLSEEGSSGLHTTAVRGLASPQMRVAAGWWF